MGRRDVCWLLLGATALLASLAGHALQLSIESAHLFGGVRAIYTHALQSPFAYLALGLLLLACFFIARGVIESVRDEFDDAQWLLPALDAIRAISAARLIGVVFCLQLASLVVGELSEQALSSYDAFGLGAVFGSGHFSAPFVHALVGTMFALGLRAFARAACEQVATVARLVLVVIARVSQLARPHCAPLLRTLALRSESPAPPLLARHIASRPPPVLAVLVA